MGIRVGKDVSACVVIVVKHVKVVVMINMVAVGRGDRSICVEQMIGVAVAMRGVSMVIVDVRPIVMLGESRPCPSVCIQEGQG